MGTESISLEYDSTTVNANLDYTTATISATVTSITPDSANPALKGVMTIAGSGFGTDDSVVKVYLANTSGKVYEMRILTIIDTQIECGIPGGLPGDFDVVVEIDGLGDVPASPVTANDFTYELTIDSISPTTGSHYGGTLITLTGKNFSPEISETLVSVGD